MTAWPKSKAGNTSNTGLPIYSYVLGGKANHGPNLYAPVLQGLRSPRSLRLHSVQLAKDRHQWRRGHCL